MGKVYYSPVGNQTGLVLTLVLDYISVIYFFEKRKRFVHFFYRNPNLEELDCSCKAVELFIEP